MWKSDSQKEESTNGDTPNRYLITIKITTKIMLNNHIQPTFKKSRPNSSLHKQRTKQSKMQAVDIISQNAEQTETTSSVTNNSKHHGNSSISIRQGREQQ